MMIWIGVLFKKGTFKDLDITPLNILRTPLICNFWSNLIFGRRKLKKPAGIGCFCLLAILAVSLIYLLLQIALSHQLLLPHIGLLLRLPSPHPQSTPHPHHHPPCPHYHEQAVCWSLRGGERQSD